MRRVRPIRKRSCGSSTSATLHGNRAGRLRKLSCEPLEDRRLLSVGVPQLTIELFNASPALAVENQGQWVDESVRSMHQVENLGEISLYGTANDDVFTVNQATEFGQVSVLLNSVLLGTYTLPPLDSLRLYGQGGNDTVIVNARTTDDTIRIEHASVVANEATITGDSIEIWRANGLGGNDIFSFVAGAATVDGGAGTDTLIGPDTNSSWQVTGPAGGSINGTLAFSNVENLTGGAQQDVFQLTGSASLAGQIDGGGGIDGLDYSLSDLSGVQVDLGAGSATGIGGGLAGKLFNLRNVTGTSGRDTLIGNALDNRLVGGAGNDLLTGGAGNDTLVGGPGHDTYSFDADAPLGNDVLSEGGGGSDTLDFSTTTTQVVNVNLGLATSQVVNANLTLTLLSAATFESVIGGALGDTLIGNGLRNALTGGRGNDTLIGGANKDTLNGGRDNDTLIGGEDDDTYVFDADVPCGSDILDESGGGSDTLDFSPTTNQAVSVNLGLAAAQAVNANLTLTLSSASTFERLIGGSQGDTLAGNALENRLTGGPGNDLLAGGAGNDVYLFAANAALGSDVLDESGGGSDTLDFSTTTTQAISVNLGQATAQAVNAYLTLTLSSGSTFENVIGGWLDDQITGNARNNTLNGNRGNDLVLGGSGHDLLIGGRDNDTLVGGAGNDTYQFDADNALGSDTLDESGGGTDTLDFTPTSARGVSINLGLATAQVVNACLSLTLSSGSAFEAVLGSWLGDLIIGNALDNWLTGARGNDTLKGGAGNDTYLFDADLALGRDTLDESGGGSDTLDFSATTAQAISANLALATVQTVNANLSLVLSSDSTFESVIGGSLDDSITGNTSANVLLGSMGNDTLRGGGGRDMLIGGAGADELYGGLGEDILIAGPISYYNETTRSLNLKALSAILAEWTRTDLTSSTDPTGYQRRVGHLLSGGGLNGAYKLDTGTVQNDSSAVDSLLGEQDLDWFLTSIEDALPDPPVSPEIVTGVAIVTFEDPDLAEAVRRELGLAVGEPITTLDIRGLTSLAADSNVVDSLVGLEHAENLQQLKLWPSDWSAAPVGLSGLEPLEPLANLDQLVLARTGLSGSELSVLDGLTGLKTLDLRYNEISTVPELTGLGGLESVLLYGNPIADVSALAGRTVRVDLVPNKPEQAESVAQLAASLNYLPVEIFQYVYNHFEYQPYLGVMKGTQAALETRAGNDWELAGLLIELLDEAGVSARYVTGVIDVSEEDVTAWVGGADSSVAADILASAYQNPVLFSDGTVRCDHVWVEAALSAVGGGTQWVAMDPSFKRKDYQEGVPDLLSLVPFDESGYLSHTRTELPYEYYERQVSDYLAVNMPGVSLADVGYDGPIVQQSFDQIPPDLPYAVYQTNDRYNLGAVPAEWKHSATITLEQYGTPLLQHSLSIPDTSLSRLTLGYAASGSSLIPELRIDGQVVAQGSQVAAGSYMDLVVQVDGPQGTTSRTRTGYHEAGDYVAIGLHAEQMSEKLLARQATLLTQAAADYRNGLPVDRDDEIGGALAMALATYYHHSTEAVSAIADLTHFMAVPWAVEIGFAECTPNVEYFWDLTFPAVPEDVVVDLPGNIIPWATSFSGSTGNLDALEEIDGHTGSALEHALWEEQYNLESISTIKSLQLANERGVPVFVIDSTNDDVYIPQLDLSWSVVNDIQAEVDAGATVTVPRDRTPLNNWNGVGYIARYENGSAYIISGGINSAEDRNLEGGSGTGVNPGSGQSGTGGNTDTTAGDPVKVNTGAFVHDETDVELPAVGLPLSLGRHYESSSDVDLGMGTGWSHSYSDFLARRGDGIQIGSGTSTLDEPLHSYYEDARTQVIYLNSELGGAATFNALALDVATEPGQTLNNWTIRMKHTTLDAYATKAWESSGWTVVYQSNQTIDTTGWVTFDFTTPFEYNGVDNLMVDFSFNNSSYSSNGYVSTTATPQTRLVYGHSDSGYGDPLNWSGTSKPTPLYYNEIPNIRLYVDEIVWTDEEGHRYAFAADASGGYTTPPELHGTLTQTAAGYTYREKDGMVHEFDADGKLIELRDRNHNSLTIAYNGLGQIATVTDTDQPARRLNFTWSGGHIASVSDFTGRTWQYGYSGGHLTRVASPFDAQTPAAVQQYAYYADSDAALGGLLHQITAPDGGTTTIDYYANRRALQVTDAEGYAQRFYYDLYRDRTTFVDERTYETVYDYDADGYTTQIVYPDGARESYTWADALMTSWTDPFGNIETYEYDALGNLLELTDRRGTPTQFTYEPTYNQVASTTRPGGRITTFDYDANGNPTLITDALGNVTSMTYYANGLLHSRTLPLGSQTPVISDYRMLYTYNNAGQALSASNELATVTYTYDAAGNRASVTDANGNTTNYDYDVLDRLIEITDPLGHSQALTYDPAGHLLSATDALGRTVVLEYDLKGDLLRVVHPDSTSFSFGYDPAGNLAWQADELGQATHFVYSPRGQVIQTLYPDGASTRRRYDGAKRLLASIDGLGNETRFGYDAEDRLLEMIDALGQPTTNTYDAVGNLKTITDRRGGVTTYEYDLLNRVTEIRGEGGFIFTTDYDANGNVVQTAQYDVTGLGTIPDDPRTLPPSRKRIYETVYDVLDRPVQQIDPLGHSTYTQYDPGGRVTRTTDELGHHTDYQYDRADNLIRRTNPDGGVVQYSYDEVYRCIGLAMPEGGLWQWEYDSRDRAIAQIDPLGRRTTFNYDAVDEVLRQLNPDGSWIRNTYDEMCRLTERERSDGSCDRFTYDSNGNLTLAQNEHSDLALTYDALNRCTGETTTMTDGSSWAVGAWGVFYQYDEEGNVVRMTDTWGTTVDYTFDLAGRLTSLDSSRGESAVVGYSGYSQRKTITYGNGRVDTLAYDGEGQLSSITYGGPGAASSISYTRDAAGTPVTITEHLGGVAETLSIQNDVMGRPVVVTAAVNSARTESFSYDLNGNLINTGAATGCTFDAADQLLASSEGTYEYDEQGNLTVAHNADGSRVETLHDPSNRIVATREYNAAGALVREVRYVYDALGRRIKMVDQGQEIHRTFAFDNMINMSGAGSVTHYLVGPALDDVFAANVDFETRYIHRDQIGSIRMVTGATGTIMSTASYSLFGRPVASTGTNDTGLGFTARPVDTETGLIDTRIRLYAPSLGRFLVPDPVRTVFLGASLYGYCLNQPLVFADPLGLMPQRPGATCPSDYKDYINSEEFVEDYINGRIGREEGLITGVGDTRSHAGEGFDYVVHTSTGNAFVDVIFSLPGIQIPVDMTIMLAHPELSDPGIQWSGHSRGGMLGDTWGVADNFYGTPGLLGQWGTGTGHAWNEYMNGPTSSSGVVNEGDWIPYLGRTKFEQGAHGEPVIGWGWDIYFD